MPRPEKPFQRKWTAEQQRAIAFAMLDAKSPLTAKQASAAAAAGTLPGAGAELEPFGPLPVSTCHDITRRERRSRGIQARGRLARAETAGEAVRIVLADAWDELDRAREDIRAQKLSGADRARALRELVTTAATIHRAERDLAGGKPSKPTPSAEPTTDKPKRQRTEADDLARAARQRAATEHTGPLATDTDDSPATDNGQTDTTHHATDADAHAQAIDRAQLASSLA